MKEYSRDGSWSQNGDHQISVAVVIILIIRWKKSSARQSTLQPEEANPEMAFNWSNSGKYVFIFSMK